LPAEDSTSHAIIERGQQTFAKQSSPVSSPRMKGI
jgi:hypothetical protein